MDWGIACVDSRCLGRVVARRTRRRRVARARRTCGRRYLPGLRRGLTGPSLEATVTGCRRIRTRGRLALCAQQQRLLHFRVQTSCKSGPFIIKQAINACASASAGTGTDTETDPTEAGIITSTITSVSTSVSTITVASTTASTCDSTPETQAPASGALRVHATGKRLSATRNMYARTVTDTGCLPRRMPRTTGPLQGVEHVAQRGDVHQIQVSVKRVL